MQITWLPRLRNIDVALTIPLRSLNPGVNPSSLSAINRRSRLYLPRKAARRRHPEVFAMAKEFRGCGNVPTRCSSSDAAAAVEQASIYGEVRISDESFVDRAAAAIGFDVLGSDVNLQLVSVDIDPESQDGKRSQTSKLKIHHASESKDSGFYVEFSVPENFGVPGAILLESYHSREFFLESITLELPGGAEIYFPCKSWINQAKLYPGPRIFFANKVCLPNQTPPGLAKLRSDELVNLRGTGTGKRETGERIYDYEVYNNLGNPDKDPALTRPVLGGSEDLPYPRRNRTGGKHTKADPASEAPSESTYVPRDEVFSPSKNKDVTAAGIRAAAHQAQTLLKGEKSFSSFEEVYDLYAGNLDPAVSLQNLDGDGSIFGFPVPEVVQASKEAWMSDAEFSRQRLAGMNPAIIERLKMFPPESRLDPAIYGRETSCISEQHIKDRLEGLSVEEAIRQKRVFILDYHDSFITPYLTKINETEGKAYASRTLFFLTNAGVLMPIAIELILPPKRSGEAWSSRVYTPPAPGTIDWLWQLAKAHVAAVDAIYQHLNAHWLKTHACLEPFIIATRRQLSAIHPLNVVLSPHSKDTMNANTAARETFLNADGRIENCFTTGKYSNEVSSMEYKRWRFDEQALPQDLIKRGMAEVDSSAEHGLKLLIEDYPYAVDALDLWAAICGWVKEYISIFYEDDEAVKGDNELQKWWREVREKGHGDHRGADWWVAMEKVAEVEEVVATIMWMATGMHAVADFGQYPFAGFMPNGPTMARRLIPEPGTAEHRQLLANPPAFFLASLGSRGEATTTMSTFEITSQHFSGEEYLGSGVGRPCDARVAAAQDRFRAAVNRANDLIVARTQPSAATPNRAGPSKVPFSLLVPFSPEGLTARGVPNSASI